MPNNKQTMIDKLGGEEAYLAWMKENASRGGKKRVAKGFSFTPNEQLIKWGKVNGAKNKKRVIIE